MGAMFPMLGVQLALCVFGPMKMTMTRAADFTPHFVIKNHRADRAPGSVISEIKCHGRQNSMILL